MHTRVVPDRPVRVSCADRSRGWSELPAAGPRPEMNSSSSFPTVRLAGNDHAQPVYVDDRRRRGDTARRGFRLWSMYGHARLLPVHFLEARNDMFFLTYKDNGGNG